VILIYREEQVVLTRDSLTKLDVNRVTKVDEINFFTFGSVPLEQLQPFQRPTVQDDWLHLPPVK